MNTILGLDISSSCIGWALLEFNNNKVTIVEYGNIKPPKKDKFTIVERLDIVTRNIDEVCNRLQPNFVVIEDIIQYMPNKTSANTILTLAVFNRAIALQVYRSTGYQPIFLLPISIRSKISKFLGIKRIEKEELPKILQDFFGKKFFTIKYKQRGKNKGQPIVETYDEADSCAAAWAGLIKLELITTNNGRI